jgi:hypothetical protein
MLNLSPSPLEKHLQRSSVCHCPLPLGWGWRFLGERDLVEAVIDGKSFRRIDRQV